MILAIVNDKPFVEMIEGEALAAGIDCLVLSDEDALQAALQEGSPQVLFLDLGIHSLDAPALIEKLKGNHATRGIPVVAFGSGIRADLMQDAREAGVRLVLPKAAFREELPNLIRRFSGTSQG